MLALTVFSIIQIYSLLVLGRVLMSWVQVDPYHPIAQFLINTTEPLLKPIRDLLPPAGGFDFSPMVLMISLQVLGEMFVRALS
jgi:YggT family protein